MRVKTYTDGVLVDTRSEAGSSLSSAGTDAAVARLRGGFTSAASRQVFVSMLHQEDPTNMIKAGLRRGFTFITVRDLIDGLEGRRALPAYPAVMTVDDGRLATYTVTHPPLETYNVPATFFITSEYLNGGTVTDPLNGIARMTWAQMRELRDTGLWDFQNHTRIHENLTVQSSATRIADLISCSDTIEAQLGVRPRAIAYPYGGFDRFVMQDAQTAGMVLGFATNWGPLRFTTLEEQRYAIPRPITTDAIWLDYAIQDLIYSWENDQPGRINAANAMGWWTLPAQASFLSTGLGDLLLDARTVRPLSAISTDYFRVYGGDRVYYRFSAESAFWTTGTGGIRLQQYDESKNALAAGPVALKDFSAVAGFAYYDGTVTLHADCRFVRLEVYANSSYDGRVTMRAGLIRRL